MKTHSYLGEDHGHPIISMKATYGAVYIIRYPRDVAVSGGDHFGRRVDAMIEMMADPLATCDAIPGIIVHEIQNSWSDHDSSWHRTNHSVFLDEIGRTTERVRVDKYMLFQVASVPTKKNNNRKK